MGRALASLLKGGEVIELIGDLGAGKTTFIQGLIRGLGYDGEITSPTFTLERTYPVRDGLTVHHFDFYRLGGHDVVSEELAEITGDKNSIAAVEWANHGAQLSLAHLKVRLRYGKNEQQREIQFEAVDANNAKIVEGLKREYSH
jgi:tRNA threonylcarbamoyladenosine biosynthesis protein TsaE